MLMNSCISIQATMSCSRHLLLMMWQP